MGVPELILEALRVLDVDQAGLAKRLKRGQPTASEFLAQRPGAEIQLRSRLGHVSRDVLSDYVTMSDRTVSEAAETASLSVRWNL